MRNRLARATLALLTAAASVAGITTAAGAIPYEPGDVGGYRVDFTTQGSASGTMNAAYTLLKGNGDLDFVFFGQGFAPGVGHTVDLHKGTCALPGAAVDAFTLNDLSNPTSIATANQAFDGTPGTMRFTQGNSTTNIQGSALEDFETEHVIVVREIGAPLTDYLCGTPAAGQIIGAGAVVGTEYPFIFTELNSSGAAATGTATLLGNILSFNLSYTGIDTVPSQHFQVLRQSGACPTVATATEAEIDGSIIMSLTRSPRSLLVADGLTPAGFGVSVATGVGGTIDYETKVPLTDVQAAAFADSIVVMHGFDVDDNGTADGGPSPVDAMLQADETAVVGCGQFKANASTVPAAPTGVTGSASPTELTIDWTAPDDGGSTIIDYTVTLAPGGATKTVNGALTTAVFTGLADGSYTATVVARNADGNSPASAASAAVEFPDLTGLPGAPTGVIARPVGQKLIVNWKAPTDTGSSPLTGYTVTLAPGGATMTVAGTTATFEELPVDTYIASVVANNAAGSSSAALSLAAIIRDCQDGDVDADWDARVVTPANGSLFRLYCGYFLRYPDDGGWDYWTGIQAGGADLILISDQFALSQEFLNTYGSLNNDQFVRLLYSNVLLREVDDEGYNYWKAFLDSGELTQGGTMRWVAEGKEFQNVTGTP